MFGSRNQNVVWFVSVGSVELYDDDRGVVRKDAARSPARLGEYAFTDLRGFPVPESTDTGLNPRDVKESSGDGPASVIPSVSRTRPSPELNPA
jgi:hypothetical protein